MSLAAIMGMVCLIFIVAMLVVKKTKTLAILFLLFYLTISVLGLITGAYMMSTLIVLTLSYTVKEVLRHDSADQQPVRHKANPMALGLGLVALALISWLVATVATIGPLTNSPWQANTSVETGRKYLHLWLPMSTLGLVAFMCNKRLQQQLIKPRGKA